MGKRVRCFGPLGAVLSLALATSAHAAVNVGETFNPTANVGTNATVFQAVSPNSQYVVPSDGVITRWAFQAGAAPPAIQFKVGRVLGPGTPPPQVTIEVVGESVLETMIPSQLNTFNTRISAKQGDVLGVFFTGSQFYLRPAPATYVIYGENGNSPAGSVMNYGPVPGQQMDLSAVLEPDCDNDGFGDETQDQDLSACPPAPTATITSGPPDKLKLKKKKKSLNVVFNFTSNEQGSTFNCVLDGQQEFKTCTSPLTVSVKKGEHTFSVTATDPGGNAGAAATDIFKVKRKKKKR